MLLFKQEPNPEELQPSSVEHVRATSQGHEKSTWPLLAFQTIQCILLFDSLDDIHCEDPALGKLHNREI